MNTSTIDDLKQKWTEGMMASQKAIRQRHGIYKDLKRLVNRINTQSLDVADYYPSAMHLAAILREMSSGYPDTIFHYFADHIDPCKKGDVRCFRMECQQLSEHFEVLDHHASEYRNIRIVT